MSNPQKSLRLCSFRPKRRSQPPVNSRRAAAQRVREARDRLTSTSGTRPAFDAELLRQYAQTRMSASYVVMLLVVATGVLFGFWMQPLLGGGLDLRHALHSCRHHPQLREVPGRAALARRHPQMADAVRAARSALRPVLDGDPDPSRRPRRRLQHADDVPDAAGDRGVEHAGGEPADRRACGDRAGDGGDRARISR